MKLKYLKTFECNLPRRSSLKQFRKMAKKAGKNKSTNVAGGSNALSGEISTKG